MSSSSDRRVYDRVMASSLMRRALASMRWRSGLDDDLAALGARLERLEQRVERTDPAVVALATRGSTKACATEADGDLLEWILAAQAARVASVLRVLEWGSGLSTLHYPSWLGSHGTRVSWTALEHDREFFRRALEPALRARGASVVWSEDLAGAESTPPPERLGVTAIVFDEGPVHPIEESPTLVADCAKDLDDYVSLPASLGRRFGAVIVDGRKRRRCLIEAANLLEDRGVTLLHDAQRPYYQAAFAAFRSWRRIGDELWIGAQHDTDFADLVPHEALVSQGLDYASGA